MHCALRNNRRIAGLIIAVVVAVLPTAASASTAFAGAPDVPSLADAHAEVVRSEQRLVDTTAARDAAERELTELTASSAELVAQITAARADLRQHAVGAYVASPPDETMLVLFGSDDIYDASARVNLLTSSARRADNALDRYNALKADVDPRLVELADRLQHLEHDVADANDAVLAAHANEAEAERQEALRVAAAEQARQEAAAAAAARAAAASTATTQRPTAAAMGIPSLVLDGALPADDGASPVPTPTTLPSPVPAAPDGGPSEAQWAALRKCESGGNYQAVSSSGKYRGAYQFDYQTWAGLGGSGDPAAAPPAEQDARAKRLYAARSWRPWPICGRFLR